MGVGRPVGGITSPFKVVANIFVSFIGAGMLGLPFAFMEGGIMEGAVIMGIVGYLSVTAMLMLIDCKYAILSSGGRAGGRSIIMDTKVPLIAPESSSGDDGEDDERHPPLPSTDLTYGDVGLYALGPSGKRLVDAAIIISQIGFCCGYLLYLCKNLNLYIPRIGQRVWLLFLLPPLYCLTLLRHLNKLAIFSMFAQVSNVLALAVVFWFDFEHSEEVPFTPNEYSLAGFPFFFAVAIYCYEGAGMILSLEESMAEHKRHKFRPIFVCTMSGLTLLYICFGVSGYASFGPHTMDIITLNLPHGEGAIDFAAIVKICLGISLFFTYPMMLFPVTHMLDKTFGFNTAPAKGNVVRLILVGMTGLVVSMVPNFAILMSLIGATCCTLLAFILPASFHLSIFKQRLTKKQRYFDIMLIVLGVVGSVIGLWDAFKRMNEAHDPLVDLNEFSSVKNGTLHLPGNPTVAPKFDPNAPNHPPSDPLHPNDPRSSVAGMVIAGIEKGKVKYGVDLPAARQSATTSTTSTISKYPKVESKDINKDSFKTTEGESKFDNETKADEISNIDTSEEKRGSHESPQSDSQETSSNSSEAKVQFHTTRDPKLDIEDTTQRRSLNPSANPAVKNLDPKMDNLASNLASKPFPSVPEAKVIEREKEIKDIKESKVLPALENKKTGAKPASGSPKVSDVPLAKSDVKT